jgi:opacity protein-like surface antigen
MVRRLAVLALALVLPALAHAQYDPRRAHRRLEYGPPPVGPTFSAWVGYGTGSGRISAEGDGPLGDLVDSKVPVGVEAAYRFSPLLHAGVFVEGAPLSVSGSSCVGGDPCGGTDFELGLDVQVHFAPYRRFDPWVGIGLGYEWMRVDATNFTDNIPDTWRYQGWTFPRISAGLDIPVSPVFSLGPYIAYDAGQFGQVDQSSRGRFDIRNQAYHGWFQLGIRGNLNL